MSVDPPLTGGFPVATERLRIQERVLIKAPGAEVFALLIDRLRLLQFSPDWDGVPPQEYSPTFPQSGSFYVRTPRGDERPPERTIVLDFQPQRLFAYRVEGAGRTDTWQVENAEDGVWLSLQQDLPLNSGPEAPAEVADDGGYEPANPERTSQETARQAARLWLESIQRYAELREGRLSLLMRSLTDRYLLRLRADQRRVILMVLALQVITCLTFVAAAVGFGVLRTVLANIP